MGENEDLGVLFREVEDLKENESNTEVSYRVVDAGVEELVEQVFLECDFLCHNGRHSQSKKETFD